MHAPLARHPIPAGNSANHRPIQDLHVKIINAATGEPLRELTLDPTKDYQPTGAPKGPKRKKIRT
jgi:hypothetical protein